MSVGSLVRHKLLNFYPDAYHAALDHSLFTNNCSFLRLALSLTGSDRLHRLHVDRGTKGAAFGLGVSGCAYKLRNHGRSQNAVQTKAQKVGFATAVADGAGEREAGKM